MAPAMEERLAGYRRWLAREPAARPLTGILWEADIPGLPEFLDGLREDRQVLPEAIRPRDVPGAHRASGRGRGRG